METNSPTPQRPPGRREEIGSADRLSPTRGNPRRRGVLRRLGWPVWSVIAVVTVLAAGVAVVQWTNRTGEIPVQDATLSGYPTTLPQGVTPTTTPPSSTSPAPSGPASPKPSRPAPKKTTGGTAAPAPRTGAGKPAPTTATTTTDAGDGGDAGDPSGSVPTTDDPPDVADPSVNIAASQAAQASSEMPGLPVSNVADGNDESYWESRPGFPQTLTIDLGRLTTVGRLTLALPKNSGWPSRTQTIAVQISSDGNTFDEVRGADSYYFGGTADPGDALIGFERSTARYLRLVFTGNSEWGAAQVGELAVYSS